MTGISLHGDSFNSQNAYHDSPEQCYQKLYRVATYFGICQFGVTLFFDRGNKVLDHATFNFQCFDTNKDINLSPSSIAFLVTNGFDLNNWVRNGIACANTTGEKQLKEEFDRKVKRMTEKERSAQIISQTASQTSSQTSSSSSVKEEDLIVLDYEVDIQVAETAIKALDEFVKTLPDFRKKQELELSNMLEEEIAHVPMLEVVLGSLTSPKMRKYVYQQLELPKYKNLGLIYEKRGNDGIAVMAPNKFQTETRIDKETCSMKKEFESKLGLRMVWKEIVNVCKNRNVCLVGHNCFADLLFLLHQFETLPEDYLEFKQLVNNLFPRIFDTKLMASVGHSNNWWHSPATSLDKLLNNQFDLKTDKANYDTEPKEDALSSASSSSSSPSPLPHVSSKYTVKSVVLCEQLQTTHVATSDTAATVTTNGGSGFDKYELNQNCFHEAGYDAYCTGVVFIRLIESWYKYNKYSVATHKNSSIIFPNSELHFEDLFCSDLPMNKLNLMRSPFVMKLDSVEDPPANGEKSKQEVAKRKFGHVDSEGGLAGDGQTRKRRTRDSFILQIAEGPGVNNENPVVSWVRSVFGFK